MVVSVSLSVWLCIVVVVVVVVCECAFACTHAVVLIAFQLAVAVAVLQTLSSFSLATTGGKATRGELSFAQPTRHRYDPAFGSMGDESKLEPWKRSKHTPHTHTQKKITYFHTQTHTNQHTRSVQQYTRLFTYHGQ